MHGLRESEEPAHSRCELSCEIHTAGRNAPTHTTTSSCVCVCVCMGTDDAEALAREYASNYFLTVVDHYEIMSDHFKDIRGYEHYSTSAEVFQAVGLEAAANGYVELHTWGTPQQILEKLDARRRLIGDFEMLLIPSYGGGTRIAWPAL